jgi:hypothetical protein
MKIQAYILLGLSILCGCGGGGSDDVSIEGEWIGKVKFADSSCTSDPQIVDVTGDEFRFTVSRSTNTDSVVVVKDQLGRTYSGIDNGNSPEGFIVSSDSFFKSDPDGSSDENDGPTDIKFSNIGDSTAEVQLNYFQNRFCSFIFNGEFERIGG